MLDLETILFATDFSMWSQRAFAIAAALARDYKARLIILHVIEPASVGYDEVIAKAPDDQTRRLAAEQAIRKFDPGPAIAVEYRVKEGSAAEEIVTTAEMNHCDLIVLGTHGRSGLARVLMGSVAESVLRHSSCPVLTVKDLP